MGFTITWLIFWVFADTPKVDFQGNDWSDWAIGLLVCLIIDFFRLAASKTTERS